MILQRGFSCHGHGAFPSTTPILELSPSREGTPPGEKPGIKIGPHLQTPNALASETLGPLPLDGLDERVRREEGAAASERP